MQGDSLRSEDSSRPRAPATRAPSAAWSSRTAAELHAHCYRMLGSVHDAEDALQDALLRAWRGLARFEGRSSLRTWLYRIATNACLDAIDAPAEARAPARLRPGADPREAPGGRSPSRSGSSRTPTGSSACADGSAAPEARYEQRESLELAFVAALQHLPARQRAVLILREVLGFSAARDRRGARARRSPSVNSALQRARKVDRRAAPRAEPAGDAARARRRAARARSSRATWTPWSAADVDAVLALLDRGRHVVDAADGELVPRAATRSRAFLRRACPRPQRWRHVPTQANGQLAVGCYRWVEERRLLRPARSSTC